MLRTTHAVAAGAILICALAAPAPTASAFQPIVELPGFSSTDQVAVDSPLHRVFVLGDDAARRDGRLFAMIDSRTDEPIGSPVPIEGGDFIAADPVSHRVFVTDMESARISVLDGRTGALIVRSAPLGRLIGQVVVDPYAARLFVMDDQRHLITLDESGGVIRSVTVPNAGTSVAVDFTGQKAYVPTDGRGVAVVDTEGGAVIGSVAVSGATGSIAADSLNRSVMVATAGSVVTIDTRTDIVAATTPMGYDTNRPIGVDIVGHTYLARDSDTIVFAVTGTTVRRLAVDSLGSMGVDYLLHKVYASYTNRPWVSMLAL
ncbi:YncE family protein [Herbiconiux liangxiaofengii]|uniref:YncE family protein n=1 Tax=Herbiconiux liangxiaofengii TaxID=3342795 RepID=UPI0035B7135C